MISIALAGLLIVSSNGQDPTTHVTYSTRAARASVVLTELSALAKVDLEGTPQTADEVLVIDVKDVPLNDLMSRIATVTSGEWKHEGSVYRLVASEIQRRKEEQADNAKKTADIKKALNEKIKAEKEQADRVAKAIAQMQAKAKEKSKDDKKDNKKGAGDADEAQPDPEMFMGDDGGTVITQLLSGLDPSVLAKVGPEDRVVFSTNPTRMQRSLSGDAPEIINTFIQQHNDKVAKSPSPVVDQAANGEDQGPVGSMMMKQMKMRGEKIGAVAKALLIYHRSDFLGNDSDQVELRFYDAKGGVIYSTTSSLRTNGEGQNSVVVDGDTATAPPAPATAVPPVPAKTSPQKHTPIQFSDDSKEFAKVLATLQGGFSTTTLNLTPAMAGKVYAPDRFDPLSFFATDELVAYAKSKGLPLVADVPDDWESMMDQKIDPNMSVESVAQRIKDGQKMVQVEDSGYTVLKPAEPVESREQRANRVALAQLLNAGQQKGVASLDDMAAFAAASPAPSTKGIDLGYIALFVPCDLFELMRAPELWPTLRFYANLTPDARLSLSNGGKLEFSTLSEAQLSALGRLVYGVGHLSVDGQQNALEDIPFLALMDFMGSTDTDYRGEPTEVAPTGIPANGYLEVTTKRESFATPAPLPGKPTVGILGALGPEAMMFLDQMSRDEGASQIPKIRQFRIGDSVVLNFTFHLSPQVSVKETLHDRRIAKDAPVVADNNLPADFKKQIDDFAAKMKKLGMNDVGGMVTSGIHP